MTLPVWVRLALNRLVPPEFAADVLADIEEGFRRRRDAGRWAAVWLVAEVVRTPYVALWRQARRQRATAPASLAKGRGGGHTDAVEAVALAGRSLARRPVFAAVSLLTLTCGIGSATVVFGTIGHILLRPLPYPDGDRVREIWVTNRSWRESPVEALRQNWDASDLTGAMLERLRAPSDGVVGMGGFRRWDARVGEVGRPAELLSGAWVGAGFFETLGMTPLAGRLPTRAEAASGAHVVVLSEGVRRDRYGDAADVIGRRVELDGRPYAVVGVMPDGFAPPGEVHDWWAPIPGDLVEELRDAPGYRAVARLEDGANPGAVAVALSDRVREMARADDRYETLGIRLASPRSAEVRPVRASLALLLGGGALVLLVALVNQGTLVSARAAGRRGERAIRIALGARRSALLDTTISEVLLLCASAGAAADLLAARVAGPFVDLLREGIPGFPDLAGAALDPWTLRLVCAGVTLVALAAGFFPALAARTSAPWRDFRSRRTLGRLTGPTQRTLLRVEAAIATLCAVVAVLLIRSALAVSSADPGFDAASVVAVSIRPGEDRYPDDASMDRLGLRLEAALADLPGVRSVARADGPPGLGMWRMELVRSDGSPADSAWLQTVVAVSPGYFRTLGMSLTAGRDFRPSDGGDAPGVAIVSELLARRMFGSADPLGRTMFVGHGTRLEGKGVGSDGETPVTVVGVASDVRLAPDEPPEAMLYLSIRQHGYRPLYAMVRGSGPGAPPARSVRAAVQGADPHLLVGDARVVADAMTRWSAPFQVRMVLTLALACLASLLTSVGVYAVVTYIVSDRTAEIGLRRALGAPASIEVPRVMRLAIGPVIQGAVPGLAAAWLAAHLSADMLFGVAALDMPSYTVALAAAMLPAALAAGLAARRVLLVDPVRALTEG